MIKLVSERQLIGACGVRWNWEGSELEMRPVLPLDLAAFVREQVDAGRYADEADVVRDAVRRLAAQITVDEAAQQAALRAALAPGLADASAGRFAAGGIMASAERAGASPSAPPKG